MKTTTLFFIFLGSFFYSIAQDAKEKDDGFFFRVESDSLGVCYGKSLVRAKFNTLEKEVVIKKEVRKIIPVKYYHYDTVQLDFYYLYHKDPNLKFIINSVDTGTQLILIKKESSRLIPPYHTDMLDCLETVTEQYIETPSYKKWGFNNNQNLSNSNNWKLLDTEEVYGTRTKQVVKTPDCGGIPRVVFVPAEYFRAIKIIPKKGLKEYEMNNIKLLCKKYYIQKTLEITTETKLIEPEIIGLEKEIYLSKPAMAEYIKILCKINSTLISKIQKQLYALGFYSGNILGELTNETKEAIINYQIKNNLPIGQLDTETVEQILNAKTAFNQ